MKSSNFDIGIEVNCIILYVYAHSDINVDEEITISYGSGYVKEQFGEIIEEFNPSFIIEHNYILNIHDRYIRNDICKNILMYHICIHYGLYLHNDLICTTERFLEYFTKNISTVCNIESINDWIQKRIKDLVYKLSVFEI